jgi:hypothetical protein
MTEVVLIFVITAAGTCGELCVALAMKRVGEVVDFRPSAILHALSGAFGIGWLWVGVLWLSRDS